MQRRSRKDWLYFEHQCVMAAHNEHMHKNTAPFIFHNKSYLLLFNRKFLYLLLIVVPGLYFSSGYAQTPKIDSLQRLLQQQKADSNRATLLWQLAEQYQSFKPDTSLQLAQKALLLSRRLQFTEGESRSLAVLATSQYLLGNYPKALSNYMLKLQIEEKRNSPRNYASALNNIGLMYILLEEYKNAIGYLYRADSIINITGGQAKKDLQYSISVNMGEAYYRAGNADSAKMYFDRSLVLAMQTADSIDIGTSLLAEANVLSLKNDDEHALDYYGKAYNYLAQSDEDDMLCEVTLGLAKLYQRIGRNDSAAYFGRMSYKMAEAARFLSRELDAAQFLSSHFKKINRFDSAFNYMERAITLKDTLKGQEKIKQAIALSNDEKLRQEERADEILREKEARFHQLQLLVIIICIPILFLLTIIINRVKIHRTVIRFMGVISLLFLFEFITLLLHPVVAEFTHHILILELLIFVAIAAFIIPIHHKLEHLFISKLTKHTEHGHIETGDLKNKFLRCYRRNCTTHT